MTTPDSSTVAVKLSRNARRALKKANRKPGRATQSHQTASQILNGNGYKTFAPIIPVTDAEHWHMDSFLMVRYRECREGRGDNDMWSCLFTAILEGWSIMKLTPLDNEDYMRRTLTAAAKAWDAAYLHFLKTGIVSEANMDIVLSAINIVLDLKRDFRRDELIAVIENLEDNLDKFVLEIFDGSYPKCGWEPRAPYEERL